MAQAVEAAGKIGQVVTTGYCSPNTARRALAALVAIVTVVTTLSAAGAVLTRGSVSIA